jgi:hypothetical protein
MALQAVGLCFGQSLLHAYPCPRGSFSSVPTFEGTSWIGNARPRQRQVWVVLSATTLDVSAVRPVRIACLVLWCSACVCVLVGGEGGCRGMRVGL